MRHRRSKRKFSRTASHRRAMLSNMAASLLRHEIIKTTLPRAKDLRSVVEKLITLSKVDSTHRRRLAFAKLRDKAVVTKLFNDIGPLFAARPGGYSRVLKCGFRTSDAAPMAYIELVEKTQPQPVVVEDAA